MNLAHYPLTKARPHQLLVHTESRQLEIAWDDELQTRIAFAELRRFCACAWCRKAGRIGSAPPATGIDIKAVNLVGDSGLQFVFADGHNKGFYSWEYLQQIAAGNAGPAP